jgi:hypothetical protein
MVTSVLALALLTIAGVRAGAQQGYDLYEQALVKERAVAIWTRRSPSTGESSPSTRKIASWRQKL